MEWERGKRGGGLFSSSVVRMQDLEWSDDRIFLGSNPAGDSKLVHVRLTYIANQGINV